MKKILIGMDISQLAHPGGVATYTKNIAENLSKITDLEMIFFYSSLRKPYKGSLSNVKSYKLPPSIFELFFNKIRNVRIEKFLGSLDIFHSSDWTQPPAKAKKITTYHDLVPLKYPQWSNPKIVSVHKRRLKLVEREIDRVIAVSQATKKDLIETSKIPQEKITVIYEGPTAEFKQPSREELQEFSRKYSLPEKFVLAIGGIGQRRNLSRIKDACKGYSLLVAGQDLPWLSTGELGLLYHSAHLLMYCSLYEGFGLPILDAFTCGLPVVTSSVSSMPEVGGEAALYVDPLDIDDIKNKLKIVWEDKELRQEMIKKGFVQAKKFSWEKCARETAAVYREMIG